MKSGVILCLSGWRLSGPSRLLAPLPLPLQRDVGFLWSVWAQAVHHHCTLSFSVRNISVTQTCAPSKVNPNNKVKNYRNFCSCCSGLLSSPSSNSTSLPRNNKSQNGRRQKVRFADKQTLAGEPASETSSTINDRRQPLPRVTLYQLEANERGQAAEIENQKTKETKQVIVEEEQEERQVFDDRITSNKKSPPQELWVPGRCNNRSAKNNRSQSSGKTGATSTKAAEDFEWRILWRAARDYRQTDHYDYSLYGLDTQLDRAVAIHQREVMQYNRDRHLKEEQAKLVAPNLKQSPISFMSLNPTYELQNKPLCLEYPATVENLRLNNTGFSWEVKLPYQISMTSSLHGAHLLSSHRYRLDQFHCHWGRNDQDGSEHMVDNRAYSAELHFVHYNMEKYHTLSKAARHPDGLVVLAVFIDAQDDYNNHAELEKICSHLKLVQLKGEHSIIRQAVRIENLLPANRSYWSYQGSLTTPPYLESVTWFVLKNPIKCNTSQIRRFRSIKSTLRHDVIATIKEQRSSSDNQSTDEDEPEDSSDGTNSSNSVFIKSNHRKTQPLNGRTIVTYDE